MSGSSLETERQSSKVKDFLMMLALWLPFVHCCHYVLTYARDAPWEDGIYIYWFLKQMLAGQLDWLQVITFQHNEHRLGFPYALNVTLAHFTHFNTLYQIYASLVLMGGITAVVIFFCAKTFRAANVPLIAALPATWLICSVRQSENLFIALQDLLFMSCFFLVLSLYHASKIEKFGPRIFVAMLFAYMSAFSNGNGLLCLPLGFAAMWCNSIFRANPRVTRIKLSALWLFGSLATIVAYFWNYNFHGGGSGKVTLDYLRRHPLGPAEFFATFLSSPITYDVGTGVAVGLAFIALTAASAYALFKDRSKLGNDLIFPGALFGYGMLSAGMAAWGRGALVLVAALSSRYAGFANYAWLGLYLTVILAKTINPKIRYCVIGALLSVLLMGYATTTRFEKDQGVSWLDHNLRMENIMYTYKMQGKNALQEYDADFPAFVVTFCKFLEDNHLSVYSRPIPSLVGAERQDSSLTQYSFGIDDVNATPAFIRNGLPTYNVDLGQPPEIFIKGWVVPTNIKQAPSAVFLQIDDQAPIITAYRLSRDEFLLRGLANTYCGYGFESSFRTNLLNSGMHSVKLVILGTRGKTYCVTPELMHINLVGLTPIPR